jgi:hypothetical protein
MIPNAVVFPAVRSRMTVCIRQFRNSYELSLCLSFSFRLPRDPRHSCLHTGWVLLMVL